MVRPACKKACCRSTPRCASCPVLVARARSAAARRTSLFDEIYGGRPSALPASVTDALVALSLARRPRRARSDALIGDDGGG